NEVSNRYDTNILHSFNNFTVLFHLYYYDIKDKVRYELGKIHQTIRHFDSLKDFQFTDGKVINGFNWNQSFGTTECWLAFYENKYNKHRVAPQFYASISEERIRFGLVHGDNHSDFGVEDIETIKDSAQFTYEQLEEKMNDVATEIKK